MMKLGRIWFVNVNYSMFESNVVVYGLKWRCPNISVVVVELLEMTQCPYENVSLIFCFLKCCAYMSRRNTSQRPEERSDRLRLGRPTSTSGARREKQVVLVPLADRGRGGEARDLLVLMMWGPHRHRQVYPRRWTRRSISGRRIRLIMWTLNNIILMRINNISITLILSRSRLILSSR